MFRLRRRLRGVYRLRRIVRLVGIPKVLVCHRRDRHCRVPHSRIPEPGTRTRGVRVSPTLADQAIVPIETSRTAAIREIGDLVKTRDVIDMQSGVICDWLATRQDGKGVSIRQEISVGGRVFRRTLRASVVIKTW